MSSSWRNRKEYAHYRRVLRPLVLARDGYKCQLAYPGEWRTRNGQVRKCTGVADQVHHTLGKAVTGDDIKYMVATCQACNLKAGEPSKQADPPCRTPSWL